MLHAVPLVLFTFLLAWANLAIAAERDVDPTAGDDSRDGVDKPVRTIARAIALAVPGDTIHLQPIVHHDWAPFPPICHAVLSDFRGGLGVPAGINS